MAAEGNGLRREVGLDLGEGWHSALCQEHAAVFGDDHPVPVKQEPCSEDSILEDRGGGRNE